MRRVLEAIVPGARVFFAGGAGEPTSLVAALDADPERTRGVSFLTTAIPGINRLNPDRWHPTARVSAFMMQPGFAAAQRAGQFRHIPSSYNAAQTWFATSAPIDVCVVQVSMPDDKGYCSLGPTVELFPTLFAKAKKRVAIINAKTPRLDGAPSVLLSEFTVSTEADTALPTYDAGALDGPAAAISASICGFIGDGAALQVGIGKVPAQILKSLASRRGLRIVTGMYGDGVERLAAAGALDGDFAHRACMALGTPALLEALRDLPHLSLRGCEVTHDVATLARVNGLIAVNSALEVDLFGQCNLEFADAHAVSGCGGAPDFARAAKIASGGLSIVGLQSTAQRGTVTRIVAQLRPPGVATLPRHDVDLIVTEHGVADLRAKSVHERAEALIAIAAPGFRTELAEAWRKIADAL